MKLMTWILASSALWLAAPKRAWATAETDLAKAGSAGQAVFLIVTEGAASGIDLARKVAAEAQKIATDAAVVEMDRADPASQALVKRFRLQSAPVPLILVVASNGVAAGGARPHLVTASRLAEMVPSPAKAAHLKALDEKKASILVFSASATEGRAAAIQAANDAVAALEGAAVVTAVDSDSAKEATFLAELKVDAKAKTPVTAVINAKGQATGTFLGVPSVEGLVEAARKESQPCCPGGRCGPDGCK